MESQNYISLAIRNIREMFKNGGFSKSDEAWSYWCIVYKNGEEVIVDNFSVIWNGGLPRMNAREIKEIRSWFSNGPQGYHSEEIYTKDTYSQTDNAKGLQAANDAEIAE